MTVWDFKQIQDTSGHDGGKALIHCQGDTGVYQNP